MNDALHRKIADSGAIVSWLGWALSHIGALNQLLQTVLLLVSIVAGLVPIRYHLKRRQNR